MGNVPYPDLLGSRVPPVIVYEEFADISTAWRQK